MNQDLITAQAMLGAQKAPGDVRVPQTRNLEKIQEKAEEFEAVFLATMLGPMFEGIETDGPFGGGHGEEVFRSLMLQEYGKVMAKRGGIGLADHIMQSMLAAQEAK